MGSTIVGRDFLENGDPIMDEIVAALPVVSGLNMESHNEYQVEGLGESLVSGIVTMGENGRGATQEYSAEW